MLTIKKFVFSPFSENTYVLSDESQSCVVVDPGCYEREEKAELRTYIDQNDLKVEKVLNTHCHIDHIFGNSFVLDTYQVPLVAHKLEEMNIRGSLTVKDLFGLNLDPSPNPDVYVDGGDRVGFGNTEFEVLFLPGHAPGHVGFFHRESKQIFSGDVLFEGSIGRTDLPGGSMDVLMESIFKTLLPLGDDVKVWNGHGPETTLGRERASNPFLLQYASSFRD